MQLDKLLSIEDFHRAAKKKLPRVVYEYMRGGTEDEQSLNMNRMAFQYFMLKPRGLVGVEERNQEVSLFGEKYASAFGISPMGVTAICRRHCDLDLACAAFKHKLPFIISGASCDPLETIQSQTENSAWYQGYFPGDKERLKRIVERLINANIKVLVITSDTPVAANRENNQRNGFTIPFKISPSICMDGLAHPAWLYETFYKTLIHDGVPRFMNLYEEPGPPITAEPKQGFRGGRDKLTWEHMRWLREIWPGKMIIKGVLHPEDARMAVKTGMDGIIVSNHGGRQLDSAMPPLLALPAIRNAVPNTFMVMLDGGIRRGTDIIKAYALGANYVFIGRPALYGASVAGEPGVSRVLDIFTTEIDRNMALLGCNRISQLDQGIIDQMPLYSLGNKMPVCQT